MLTVRQVLELIGLSLASVFLVAKFVVNGVIGSGIGPVKNDTGVISDIFETEVSLSLYIIIIYYSLVAKHPFNWRVAHRGCKQESHCPAP